MRHSSGTLAVDIAVDGLVATRVTGWMGEAFYCGTPATVQKTTVRVQLRLPTEVRADAPYRVDDLRNRRAVQRSWIAGEGPVPARGPSR